jgi:hypothetical protein
MNGVVEIVPAAKEATPAQIIAPPVTVTIDPALVITNDSGSIKLQWPVTASSYMLEATMNLTEPFTMFGYSETTNTDSGVISLTITNSFTHMFFRLRKP